MALAAVGCLEDKGTPRGDAVAVELVVHGVVTSVDTAVSGGLFVSRARVEVAATASGRAAPLIEVEFIGGAVGGIGQSISGGMTLVPGEEVVLFLARARTGAWVAAQGAAAKYRVLRPSGAIPLAVRDLPGEEAVPLAELLGAVSSTEPRVPTAGTGEPTPYVRTTTGPYCGPDYPIVPLAWFTHSVPYVIDAAGSDDIADDSEIAAVQAAAQTWEDVPCSDLRLPFAGTVTGVSPGFIFEGENENLVIWADEPRFPPYVAVATVTFSCLTGEIVDSDIIFNDALQPFSTAEEGGGSGYDVQAVATHELGHLLGFDHSPAFDSTMDALIAPGDIEKRTLTSGDALGLCDVYVPGAGKTGHDDRPWPLHVRGPGAGPICGDGICDRDEDSTTCARDCPPCGNGVCEAFESCESCVGDCGGCACGDGWCTSGECASCAQDCPDGCFCGDVCAFGPPQDPSCGPCQAEVCAIEPSCCADFWHPGCAFAAESICGVDCGFVVCGDGVCEDGEGCQFCPDDCGACFCGDGVCTGGECATCGADCPGGCACYDVCGEGPPQDPSCGPCQAEVCAFEPFCCEVAWEPFCRDLARDLCAADCPSICGNGICEADEDSFTCSSDCMAPPPPPPPPP
jgi:hypothetical protein